PGFGGAAARGVSEGHIGGTQSGGSASGVHYGELRFSPALSTACERGRTAARAVGRQGVRDHGAPRGDDAAAGGRAGRATIMMEDQPLPPEPVKVPPPPDRDPFWSYMDLAVFAGMAIPCMLLGFGVVGLVVWLLGLHPANKVAELLPAQTIGYLLLFGVLYGIVRTYGRPFWPSLGWRPVHIAPMMIICAGLGTAILVAVLGNLIGTPDTEN